MEICSNCHKIMLPSIDRFVRDGSGEVAHMYPHECIRYMRDEIKQLNERMDELERENIVKILPK